MQRLAPELLEIGASVLLLPVGTDQIVSRGIGLPGEQCDKFMGALAVVERSDQRLNDTDRAVIGAGIAPGFELMRLIDVPLAEFRRSRSGRARGAHATGTLPFFRAPAKVKIGRRVVGRVAAENHEQIHFSDVDVGNEFLDRRGLVDGIRIDGFGVENSLADIAELGVDRVGQSVHSGSLVVARYHYAGALMRAQILRKSTGKRVLASSPAHVNS